MTGSSPILIFGLPRSGTSWIARIFDSHPDTLYRHEPDRRFLNSGLPLVPDAQAIESGAARARPYLQACLASSNEKTSGSPPYPKKRYRSAVAELGRTALLYALKGTSRWAPGFTQIVPVPDLIRRRDQERVRVVWKSVVALTQLGAYARIMPEARCIFVIRNPLGQISSHREGMEKGYLLDEVSGQENQGPRGAWVLKRVLSGPFGKRYGVSYEEIQSVQSWEYDAFSWAILNQVSADGTEGLSNVRLVRYEDIASEPVARSRELFEFARLEWGAPTEAFIKDSTQSGKRDEGYFSLYRDSRNQTDKWRQKLDVETAGKIGEIVCRFPVGRLYADSFMVDAKC